MVDRLNLAPSCTARYRQGVVGSSSIRGKMVLAVVALSSWAVERAQPPEEVRGMGKRDYEDTGQHDAQESSRFAGELLVVEVQHRLAEPCRKALAVFVD